MQLDELERLNDLKEKGILTEEEFTKAKKRILEDDVKDNNKNDSINTAMNGKDNIIINNTINSNKDNYPTVISIGTVLAWIIGIIIILSGIINIPKISSVFLILSGLVILPIMTDLCIKKFNAKLSGGLKFILFLLLFILGIGLI